jgi:RNA polymerase-interacting CarD/CdnL/TRCF family regulator
LVKGVAVMTDDDLGTLKIGDKIIDFGRVYRVFKISKSKSSQGKTRLIYFRPFYRKNNNQDLVCTIPEDNLSETNIRRPLSKKAIREGLAKFSLFSVPSGLINFDQTKRITSMNDFFAMVDLAKDLYYSRKGENKEFTVSQKRVFNSLIGRVSEEAAFVLAQKPDQVKKKIDLLLRRGLKNKPDKKGVLKNN